MACGVIAPCFESSTGVEVSASWHFVLPQHHDGSRQGYMMPGCLLGHVLRRCGRPTPATPIHSTFASVSSYRRRLQQDLTAHIWFVGIPLQKSVVIVRTRLTLAVPAVPIQIPSTEHTYTHMYKYNITPSPHFVPKPDGSPKAKRTRGGCSAEGVVVERAFVPRLELLPTTTVLAVVNVGARRGPRARPLLGTLYNVVQIHAHPPQGTWSCIFAQW